ncbi:MAG: amidase family protein [Pseudonocardia sp.]
MTELTYRGAGELLVELTARRVSARELLDVHAARHERMHPRLNAVVATDLERARAEARAIDERRARGEPVGPLAGLPMTVKDYFDVAGMPAVCGIPAYRDRPKDCPDAEVVALARQAGAVIWGKSNLPELAGDLQSYNEVYGTTNNPYDLARTPGGSSGGSAAALAAGLTPLEIGSDIGGSLRHPAHFCGVYALKPTFGALSLRGAVPPGPGPFVQRDMVVAGPMARTAADLRLLWNVLHGSTRPATVEPTRPVTDTRVALWLDEPEFVASAQVRAAVLTAAGALRAQGVTVEPVTAPVPAAELVETYLALLFPIIAARFPDQRFDSLVTARPGAEAAVAAGASRYGPEAVTVYATARYRDVAQAQVRRERLKDELASWFTNWDAVLCPVTPVPAFLHQHEGTLATRTLDLDGQVIPHLRCIEWTAMANALHTPAVAVPVNRTEDGLPLGAQLIGQWGQESRLLDLATALEAATGGFASPPALGGAEAAGQAP